MKGIVKSIFFAGLFLAMIGCSSTAPSGQNQAGNNEVYSGPDIPNDPNYIFASATELSQDMQMAVTKAKTTAAAEISRSIDVKVNNMEKLFKQETGVGENTEFLQDAVTATKTITSNQLNGLKEVSKKVVKEGNKYRAYILMQYPVGAAADAFMKSLKKSEKVYAQFKATQAFQELDKEVKDYEEFKEKQK
jgi:hypothetical protein